jgi:hypothetical protein
LNKRAVVLAILDNHIQIERNKRCTCGWRPTYKPGDAPFPEYRQHREHVADEITVALA